MSNCTRIEKEALPMAKMARLWAWMYYAFAKTILIEQGDAEGKELLCRCIKKYAEMRGKSVAECVSAQQLELNARNFVDNYDAPFSEVQNACLALYPDKFLSESDGTEFCPYKEMWEELPDGRDLATIYCIEFHKAMWSSYHPKLMVKQDKIMTRGDEKCTFFTYMEGDEKSGVMIFDQK